MLCCACASRRLALLLLHSSFRAPLEQETMFTWNGLNSPAGKHVAGHVAGQSLGRGSHHQMRGQQSAGVKSPTAGAKGTLCRPCSSVVLQRLSLGRRATGSGLRLQRVTAARPSHR